MSRHYYPLEMVSSPRLGLQFLLLLLFCGLLTPCSSRNSTSSDCDINEREALLSLKPIVIADGPVDSNQFWKGKGCCQWKGISCDERGHVTKLRIPASQQFYVYFNTTGAGLFEKLLSLRYLNHLDLTGSICGYCTVPVSISSMTRLQFLGTPVGVSGDISGSLGNLTSLRVIIIPDGYYRLVAMDARWLSNLTALTRLEMMGVQFRRQADLGKALRMLPSLVALNLSYSSLDNSFWRGYFSNSTLSANVRVLDLSFNNFSGAIPEGLRSLTSLEYLDLSFNSFDSSFPMWFGSMRNLIELSLRYNSLEEIRDNQSGLSFASKLKRLELQNNQISGELPRWLGELSELQVLNLSGNKLSGSVPSSFGGLLSLRDLDLHGNRLNGTVSAALGQLSNLETLDLGQNSLNGVISESHFQNLSMLRYLDLNENRLIMELDPSWTPPFQLSTMRMRSCIWGKFPQWLSRQRELRDLDLSSASISDIMPEWIVEMKLSSLNLSHNDISGTLLHWPEDLKWMDVSHNSISGPLPDAASMSAMETLYANDNDIGGSIPWSFCNLMFLSRLDLSKNKLGGSIPDCWDAPLLEHMDFSANNLVGSIPRSIGRLSSLSSLHLNNNHLSGEIPPTLIACRMLVFLDIGENDLEGAIPTWMAGGNLPILQFLRLRKNKLSGEIPSQLCSFTVLQVLDLAENRLTGTIPRCIGFMGGFNLNQNDVSQIQSMSPPYPSDSVDSPVVAPSPMMEVPPTDWDQERITQVLKGRDNVYTRIGLQLVTNLDLSRNNLVGNIPEELGSLFGLHGLNLSHNHLTGNIPNRIGHLSSLESLDLSDNLLSGSIPQSISALTSLSQLNLSHNDLSGEIQKGNQIQTLVDPSSYAENPLLCADFLPRKCHPSINSQVPSLPDHQGGEGDGDIKLEKLIVYALVTLGFACGFWGAVGSVVLNKDWGLAYFDFVDRATDRAYVAVAVKVAGMKRWMRT